MEKRNKHHSITFNDLRKLFMTMVIVMITVAISNAVFAQKSELGVGIGGLNYAGDLARGYHFSYVRPGGLLFYKMNFNNIVSVRYSATGGMISGSDSQPLDAFAVQRQASFNAVVIEGAATLEYNFIDFKADHSLNRWSPYLFFGLGVFGIFGNESQNGSNIQPVIPFGLGIKYALNPKFIINFEMGSRKTFYDYLDGISDGDITNKNYQYGNKYDTDWYNFVGLSLSYTLWKIPCPEDKK